MKASDAVFEVLKAHDVGHVFMLPGGGSMHLVDSLGRSGIPWTAMLTEQAAATAAEAYSRVTGRLGVCLVTSGPGSANAIPGVLAAWLDSTPVLFLSGQVKRADLAKGGLRQLGVQEAPIVDMVRTITNSAETLIDPSMTILTIRRAIYSASCPRSGPVWVAVPLDIQSVDVDSTKTMLSFSISPIAAKVSQLSQVLDLLETAKRPLILAGNGIHCDHAEDDFLRFASNLGVPVVTTRLGVDLIPHNHPLCFGPVGMIAPRYSNLILQNCDMLLILGARMDMATIAYDAKHLAPGATKVMVNIDAAEIDKLGCIDVPIVADVGCVIQQLLEANPVAFRGIDWLDKCAAWRDRYPFVTDDHFHGNGLSAYAFSRLLSDAIPPDATILPGAAGNACEIFLTALEVKQGQRVFHNKGTGSMGLSQAAAVGACIGSGNRLTVVVDGDGGWAMNTQELEVVRRLKLPIKFFVINNGGYASIRASQQGAFGRLTGADRTSGMTLPSIGYTANAYLIPYTSIASQRDAELRLPTILGDSCPWICEVFVRADEPREPRVASYKLPNGSMASGVLEDMLPLLPREEFNANLLEKSGVA